LPSTGSNKPRLFYGYVIVAAAFFANMVSFGTLLTFGVFFEPLLAEFGWTRAATSGAFSLQFLLQGLFGILAGRLNDKFGPRIVISCCAILSGSGYLLMPHITAIWQLYLFYGVIIGMGMSGGFVPLVSTVARWFVKSRGLMTGIVLSGVGLGTLFMAPMANWLISSYGWRTSYIIIGIIALVGTMLAAQFLKRDPGEVKLSPYGAEKANMDSLTLQTSGFSLREAIRSWQLWILFVTYICVGFYVYSIMVHIDPHAIHLGISPAIAATILGLIGGLTMGGRVLIGSFGDRIGNKSGLILSFSLISIALLWLQFAQEVWMLYLFAALFGFAFGGIAALQPPTVAELFGLRSHGALVGIISFGFTVGAAAGPAIAGYIFDTKGSYDLAFLVCIVLAVLSLILAALLKFPRREGLAGKT